MLTWMKMYEMSIIPSFDLSKTLTKGDVSKCMNSKSPKNDVPFKITIWSKSNSDQSQA